MTTTKLFASIFLVLAVLFAQVGSVAAAPPAQDSTISGTVTNIGQPETDQNGVTTVLVTLDTTQTVRISLDYAVQLGLIDQTTQQPVPLANLPTTVTINSSEVIPDEAPTEPDVSFISKLLAGFFFPDNADEMASLIDSFHTGDNDAQQTFGFGVIAQALWMSKALSKDENADADLTAQILLAKQTGIYDGFTLPDGSHPTNWGQFKKALLQKDKKNLGIIVSHHADDDNPLLQDHGKPKLKNKDKGKSNHP